MIYSWQHTTIGEICSVVTDGSHYSPKSVIRGEYMVSVKDFTPFGFDFSGCRQISKADYADLVRAGCIPEKDDILIGKDGARFFEDIVIYRQPQRPALLSSIAILRANKAVVEPEYLYYMLKSPVFKKDVRDNYGSGSAIPRIILKDFRRMPVQIPLLSVQKQVSSILSALDSRIANNSKINHHLEQMAQASFKSWFVDFEPFGGVMPDDWREGNIADTCSAIFNGGTPRRNEPLFWGGAIPWLTSGEVRQSIIIKPENCISEAGLKGSSAKWVPSLSTVVALYGATAGQVSMVAAPLTTNQAICALVPSENCAFYNYLCMRNAISKLENQAVGSAQQNISKGIVEQTPCLIPNTKDMVEFNALASPFFIAWIANLEESAKLAALRDSLLPRLMSGELSVADI